MWRSVVAGCIYGNLLMTLAIATNKQWIPNTNWNNPDNWNSGKLPCPKQNVILGSPLTTRPLAVALSGDATVYSLNLPMNGELIFHNAELSFSENTQTVMKSCPDTGDVQFVASAPKDWYNPTNWREVMDDGNPVEDPVNSALHLNQVPCQKDVVTFPQDSAFSVKSNEPITVANVFINGKLFSQTSDFKRYYTSDSGSVQFDFDSTAVSVTNEPCTDPAGCVCQTDMVRDKICSFVQCPDAVCDSPLEPDGTCCYLCGAVLTMTFSGDFKISSFKQKVLNITKSIQPSAKQRRSLSKEQKPVTVSISRIGVNLVQVVLTDNEQGKTAQLVGDQIKGELEADDTVSSFRMLQSGRSKQQPRSPDSGSSLGLALGLGIGFLSLFIIFAALLIWRRRKRLAEVQRERLNKDTSMRSHSLSLIEENHDAVEMEEIQDNDGQEVESTEQQPCANSAVKDTNNLLYESTDDVVGPATFSNPLYDSASTEDIGNAI